MLIKPKYLPTIIHQIGKNAGAWIPMGVGKRYSTSPVSRLITPTFAEFVEIRLGTNVASPTGTVDLFVYYSMQDNAAAQPVNGNYTPPTLPGLFNSSVVGSVGSEGDFEMPAWTGSGLSTVKVGTFGFNARAFGDNADLIATQFNVAEHLGGIVPSLFSIVVKNNTNVPLYGCSDYGGFDTGNAGTEAGAWCQITGVQAEAV